MSAPLVLAVESSGPRSAVALLAGGELLAEREFARGQGGRGAGSPAAAAGEALGAAGRGPQDVDLVAVSIGPGSYTGLRIGVSFAKSFAWAAGAAVVAVPSLRALAEECDAEADVLVATGDAFRGQIYARAFRREDAGALADLTGDMVLRPEELAPRLAGTVGAEERLLVFGSGAEKHAGPLHEAFEACALVADFSPQPASPSAAAVGRIGLKLFEAGKTVTAHDLVPVYLRKTEAEERLQARGGHPG